LLHNSYKKLQDSHFVANKKAKGRSLIKKFPDIKYSGVNFF